MRYRGYFTSEDGTTFWREFDDIEHAMAFIGQASHVGITLIKLVPISILTENE